MAKRARHHTVLMAVMALWCGVAETRTAAAQDAGLTMRLRNDAQLPGDLLVEAKGIVAAIYAEAGIDATFVDSRADFTIILLSRHTAKNMHQIPDAVGFAPSSQVALGRIAYVIQPRVDRIAEGYRASRAIVLAVAIAHELGHLLMFDAHSSSGIMRPDWNQADFRKAVHGKLLFTDAQAAEMRARLTGTRTPQPQ
jgi:hypothetical protein